MDEIKVVSQKGVKRTHQEIGFPISVVTAGLRPKCRQKWFSIQIQK